MKGRLVYTGIHLPIVKKFLAMLKRETISLAETPETTKIIDAFVRHLLGKLNFFMRQILQHEFPNTAATPLNSPIDAQYANIDPQDYANLLKKYVGLKILINTLLHQELQNALITIRQFMTDRDKLSNMGVIRSSDATAVTHVFILNGESHDGGKNVVLFCVDHAPKFALKIRDLRVEALSTNFIKTKVQSWIGDNNWIFPKYLISGNIGWVTWHSTEPCISIEEVKQYYFRVGVFSSISCALGTTDLHAENMVSSGSSPVFVDLETMFHHVAHEGLPVWDPLATGLFPVSLRYWGTAELIEFSGLIGNIKQEGDASIAQTSPAEGAYVLLNGVVQSPINFVSEIVAGFTIMSAHLMNRKAEFLAFIDACKDLPTRCILRSTAGYHTIIEQSFHPSLLITNEARANYIEACLTFGRSTITKDPIVSSETAACMAADVPRFETTPVNGVLRSTYHDGPLKLQVVRSGYAKAVDYINNLTDLRIASEAHKLHDVFQQLNIVVEPELNCHSSLENHVQSRSPSIDEAYVAFESILLRSIEQLVQRTIINKGILFAFQKKANVGYMFSPLNTDLFSGLGGLAYLFTTKCQHKLNNLSIRAFSNIFAQHIKSDSTENNLVGGAYVGLCSTILPLYRLKKYLNNCVFKEKIVMLQKIILDAISNKDSFLGADLVGGIGGALVVASLAWRKTEDHRWLSIANSLFDLLIGTSVVRSGIRYFPAAPRLSEHPYESLSGLSHGQAGIAYAIAMYGTCVPEKRKLIIKPLKQTIAFELDTYDYNKNLWPDYRAGIPNRDAFNFTWAYGAPGIILASQEILKHYKLPFLQKFVETIPFSRFIPDVILSQAQANDYSLSSGLLGTIAIVNRLDAGNTKINNLINSLIFRLPSRDPTHFIPGLLTGISGKYIFFQCIKTGKWNDLALLPHELCDGI